MERVVYDDESGQLVTASFMDYAMPRADVFSHITVKSNPVPTKLNPLGAKGAGEAGCVGSLPSVMNAVMNALESVDRKSVVEFRRVLFRSSWSASSMTTSRVSWLRLVLWTTRFPGPTCSAT